MDRGRDRLSPNRLPRWFVAAVMFVMTALLWLILLGWIIHLWSIIDAAVYERPERWRRGYYRGAY